MKTLSIVCLSAFSLLALFLAANAGDLTTSTTARIARLPAGSCTSAKCPGGIIQGDGYCGCITATKTAITGEVTSKESIASKDVHKMILCPPDEKGEGGGVSYPLASVELPKGCIEVLAKVLMPGVTTNAIPTGIEADLEIACSPCKVSPGSWGQCPYCLLAEGGCAMACPTTEEMK